MPFAGATPVANTVAVVVAVPGVRIDVVEAGASPPVTYSRPSRPNAIPLGEHGPGTNPTWVVAPVAAAIFQTGRRLVPPRSAT